MDKVDAILLDWHEWQLGYEPVRGYADTSVSCRDFQTSRQWMRYDELDEEVEQQLRESVGRVVDPLVMALDTRLRIAVSTGVRNLHAGSEVWTNPRWPETQADDYARAKVVLAPKLIMRGLLERDDYAEQIAAARRSG